MSKKSLLFNFGIIILINLYDELVYIKDNLCFHVCLKLDKRWMHFKTFFKSILKSSESWFRIISSNVQCVDKDLETFDSHLHVPVVYIFYTKTDLLVLCEISTSGILVIFLTLTWYLVLNTKMLLDFSTTRNCGNWDIERCESNFPCSELCQEECLQLFRLLIWFLYYTMLKIFVLPYFY